jgi:hypothetical protein
MDMPLNDDGTVEFKPTLFALVRTSLNIKMDGALDEANEDLRKTMRNIWKRQANDEILNVLLPPPGEGVGSAIAVGKLYASILIQDCFRRYLGPAPAPPKLPQVHQEEIRARVEGSAPGGERQRGAPGRAPAGRIPGRQIGGNFVN